MIGQAHLETIERRIGELQAQRNHADGRLAKTLDGMIQNEKSRLAQWQRLAEIRTFDGE